MDHAAELRESHVVPRLARRQPIEKGPQTSLDDGIWFRKPDKCSREVSFACFK